VLGTSLWGLESNWRVPLTEGTSYAGSHAFSPDALVFHEHWLGLLLTSPFLFFGLRRLKSVSAHAWASMILSGVLGSAVGTICYTQALTLLNLSQANLLLNVQPVISVLVSWYWLRERPQRSFYPWAAVALACGVALAWAPDTMQDPQRLARGLWAIAATAVCWGASTFATFGVVLAHGGAAHLNAGALLQRDVLQDVLALLLVAAITPTFIYFAGLARTRASVATFAEMAQTFAALVITWGRFGDALSPVQVAAGALLLVAVAFINRSVDEAPQPAPAPAIAPAA
jgi:drug/metabolite transporter (DMT)-like permease